MEVVGSIASVIALLEVGKKLGECVNKIPTNKRRLQDVAFGISEDLESLHDFVQSRQIDIDTPKLQDAISSLEADLQNGLSRCQKLLKSLSNSGWLRRAVIWKDSDDIETSGIARVEQCAAKIVSMTDQLSVEVHQRLDFVEDHVRLRVAKAKADPADAERLLGVARMTTPAMKNALAKASAELHRHPPTALERQYLHLKVETLTNAVMQLPVEMATHQLESSSPPTWTIHHCQTGDPWEQAEDAVVETIRILHALRTRDFSDPVTQIAADLEDLSMELLDLGLYEDARQTYVQVVRLYRASIAGESRPPIIDARIARALIGVSASFQRLGRSQEGLDPIREAEAIIRSLERDHPGAFRHELAVTMNNIANHLRDSGLYTDAMGAANEAVELRRQLARELPDAHKADLATSLLNMSTCYSKVPGLELDALEIIVEAVSLCRELAADQPECFEPYVGASLHNAANRRAAVNDDVNAYNDIQEAVLIRRKLAIGRPDVFSGGLTRSLTVAKMLALRCGDTAAAGQFDEERRRLHKSSFMDDNNSSIIILPTMDLPVPNPAMTHVSTASWYEMREPVFPGKSTLVYPDTPILSPNTVLHHVISPGTRAIRSRPLLQHMGPFHSPSQEPWHTGASTPTRILKRLFSLGK